MKKIILSALLAGVTTGLAFSNSAQALDPSKYSVGFALGWGIQDKTTYDIKDTPQDNQPQDTWTFTNTKYITQKTFPTVDLKLGYNVNSFLQLGVNALYTDKMESSLERYVLSVDPQEYSYVETQENLFDVMVRAHFYSPESSMGTALFTGPSAGWESSKLKLRETQDAQEKTEFQEPKKRKNTAILGWDMGIAQKVSGAGTSVEFMGTILADMKKEYKETDFKNDSPFEGAGVIQRIRPAARISIAVKQSF